MSDSEPDQELLELLRARFGNSTQPGAPPTTNVLRDAEFVADNSVDVAIDMNGTKALAAKVYAVLKDRPMPNPDAWSSNGLHPRIGDVLGMVQVVKVEKDTEKSTQEAKLADVNDESVIEIDTKSVGQENMASDGAVEKLNGGVEHMSIENTVIDHTQPHDAAQTEVPEQKPETTEPIKPTVLKPIHPESSEPVTQYFDETSLLNFIFTMDLLNFSFWSTQPPPTCFTVHYHDCNWTGYWSLIASLRRALEEGIPITTPSYWLTPAFTLESLAHVFRSETAESIPLLEERYKVIKSSADVLQTEFGGDVAQILSKADKSAARLVNLLAEKFPSFRDETRFERKKVRFLKRAQIFVADLWSAFDGKGYGEFGDIDHLTMFPDYRVSQQLRDFGALYYAPILDKHIRNGEMIEEGHSWEVQIRGCSIWCVELIRRTILRENPGAKVNAVTIDFFLYDLSKEIEKKGESVTKHHRTRSIWY